VERQWFDDKTGYLIIDEHIAQRASFQKILADGWITPEELRGQAESVAAMFRELERLLTPEIHARLTDALCELAVLHALQQRFLKQAQPAQQE